MGQTATEIAAAAAEETAPITIPTGVRRNRGAQRAEVRGVYRDPSGAERIVGAGDAIPDGWTYLRDADVDTSAIGVRQRVVETPDTQSVPDRTTAETKQGGGGRRGGNRPSETKQGEPPANGGGGQSDADKAKAEAAAKEKAEAEAKAKADAEAKAKADAEAKAKAAGGK